MNEMLGRGCARIDAIRASRGCFNQMTEPGNPPTDRYYAVYWSLILAGASFLLPYNSFIMAVDYFQSHYPNSSIMFDMSSVYITCACVAVITNNLLLDFFTYNTRITFGILISLVTIIFVAVCNIGWDGFPDNVSYTINLVAIGLIAFGCTIQQASYYGFTGCLPPQYTQAVMVGESAAGFWASFDRIITKLKFNDPHRSTLAFFVLSIFVLLVHTVLHQLMMKNPLVLYYFKLTNDSRQKRRIQLHLNPNEDANLMESETGDNNYGVLKLQSPEVSAKADLESTAFSFANPLYSPTATGGAPLASPPSVSELSASPSALRTPRTSYKVDDVVYEAPDRMPSVSWQAFKRGVLGRWHVAQNIYPYMVSIGLVYFTTLSVYPGITSEVLSCRLGSWMPIILMSMFNLFDFIGKIAAAWPYEWSRSQLLMASGVRLLLVPLMLLCAAPRHSPHIVGDIYPIMFSIIMGFSNGLFGSVPMIMAPSRVGREHREIAGNIMTLSYNGGLLTGSMVSYLLLNMLGPPAKNLCRVYPTPTLLMITTTTVAPTTLAANLTYLTQGI